MDVPFRLVCVSSDNTVQGSFYFLGFMNPSLETMPSVHEEMQNSK